VMLSKVCFEKKSKIPIMMLMAVVKNGRCSEIKKGWKWRERRINPFIILNGVCLFYSGLGWIVMDGGRRCHRFNSYLNFYFLLTDLIEKWTEAIISFLNLTLHMSITLRTALQMSCLHVFLEGPLFYCTPTITAVWASTRLGDFMS